MASVSTGIIISRQHSFPVAPLGHSVRKNRLFGMIQDAHTFNARERSELNEVICSGANKSTDLVDAYVLARSLAWAAVRECKDLGITALHECGELQKQKTHFWANADVWGCKHPGCGRRCEKALRNTVKRLIYRTVNLRGGLLEMAAVMRAQHEEDAQWAEAGKTLSGRYGLFH